MRNFVKVYVTNYRVEDPAGTLVIEGSTMGPDQATANGRAYAACVIADPNPTAEYFVLDSPPIYAILNKFLFIGYFTGGTLLGDGDTQHVNNMISACDAEGIDPYTSPRLQKVYPWNGISKTHYRLIPYLVGKTFK